MNAPRILSRLAIRRSCAAMHRHSASTSPSLAAAAAAGRRAYGSPSFQPYPLYPNDAPPPPRTDGGAEASIAQPDPLPKVNETRPPAKTSPLSAHQPSPSTSATTSTTTANPAAAATAPESSSSTTTSTAAEAAAQTTTSTSTSPTSPSPAKPARPRPKLRARKAAMKLTPAAVGQLRALLDQPEPKLIKVGVRNRGCSGLAYHLEYVDRPGSFDEEVMQDGVKLLIDSKALFSIIGSEMDWVEDKLSQRFVFKNPNIKEECGCGESFMI